ncbi:MAG: hypothetical protein LPD71_05545 [Shewanella sp.]|nr:hypothetical protein [Shewanella sp.]MCF1429739.1 hypothetical protein [Shewanella sp.]MCF1438215.1 hypothetical protein [Shewanella sp.]MCF1457068.1 hypothetical protein [Shewanella sp.]
MAKFSRLSLILALMLAVCIGGLSWTGFMLIKLWDTNARLQAEVTSLKSSQVMLMVPNEQAQQLSDWLGANPQRVEEVINMARQGERLNVEIDAQLPALQQLPQAEPGQQPDNRADSRQPLVVDSRAASAVITLESVDAQGIKVIRLPHGGIRVTTREDN